MSEWREKGAKDDQDKESSESMDESFSSDGISEISWMSNVDEEEEEMGPKEDNLSVIGEEMPNRESS